MPEDTIYNDIGKKVQWLLKKKPSKISDGDIRELLENYNQKYKFNQVLLILFQQNIFLKDLR